LYDNARIMSSLNVTINPSTASVLQRLRNVMSTEEFAVYCKGEILRYMMPESKFADRYQRALVYLEFLVDEERKIIGSELARQTAETMMKHAREMVEQTNNRGPKKETRKRKRGIPSDQPTPCPYRYKYRESPQYPMPPPTPQLSQQPDPMKIEEVPDISAMFDSE